MVKCKMDPQMASFPVSHGGFQAGAELRRILKDRSEAYFPSPWMLVISNPIVRVARIQNHQEEG